MVKARLVFRGTRRNPLVGNLGAPMGKGKAPTYGASNVLAIHALAPTGPGITVLLVFAISPVVRASPVVGVRRS